MVGQGKYYRQQTLKAKNKTLVWRKKARERLNKTALRA